MSHPRNLGPVRQRCAAIAAAVPVPVPFDVRALCDQVAGVRCRPIRLLPAPRPDPSVCGIWISSSVADYLVYDPTTSPVHQDHIILHELGHLLCRHPGIVRAASGRTSTPAAQVPRIVVAITRYDSIDEIEAELVASLLRGRSEKPRASRTGPDIDDPLRRLEDALLYGR
jgi:hypothetical protein